MKKLLLSCAAMLAAGSFASAQAADLKTAAPVAQAYKAPALAVPFTWAGLYADAYFQYGGDITKNDALIGTTALDLSTIPHGPGIGGALGFWLDTGTIVFGPRVSLSYLNLTDSGQLINNAIAFSSATNWLGNADLCAGLPLSPDRRLLGYGCGGVGFGGVKSALNFSQTLAGAISDTSVGWNAAAGLRYAFQKGAFPLPSSIFIEGDYYQLGDKSFPLTDATGTVVGTSTARAHIVVQKVGLSWAW